MSNEIVKKEELDLSKVTRRDVLDECKRIIQELNEHGNIHKAAAAVTALEKISDTAGLGRAYLLYGMYAWYEKHNEGDETFFSAIGITENHKIVYARRLMTVWEQIEKKAIPTDIQKRSVKVLIPIAKTLSAGYVIDDEGWLAIRMTANEQEVGEVLRNIKKTKPRSNLLALVLQPDGTIYAYRGEERRYVGFLNITDDPNDDIIEAAHNKIIDNSPIRRTS